MDGLRPFVEREMQATYGDRWQEIVTAYFAEHSFEQINWDAAAILKLMWDSWNKVFRQVLGHAERSLVSELREVRNKWAHQETFSSDDAYRALDSMDRCFPQFPGPRPKEIERQKMALLRVRFDTQTAQRQCAKKAVQPTQGKPYSGLNPGVKL